MPQNYVIPKQLEPIQLSVCTFQVPKNCNNPTGHLLQEAAHQQEDTFQVHHSAMFHTSIFMCVMQLQTSSKGSFETNNGKDMECTWWIDTAQCWIFIYLYIYLDIC